MSVYFSILFLNKIFHKFLLAGLPFGQLPVLEIDGVTYNQSSAIARYVAKQVGLAGQTDLENLQIDAMVENLSDLGNSKPVKFFKTM